MSSVCDGGRDASSVGPVTAGALGIGARSLEGQLLAAARRICAGCDSDPPIDEAAAVGTGDLHSADARRGHPLGLADGKRVRNAGEAWPVR
jgi:hypothetical protein